jgi:hypothetical protein
MNPVKVRGPTGLYAREAELEPPSRVACSDLFGILVLPQRIKPCLCLRGRPENFVQHGTGIIGTVRACADGFPGRAFPDFTQLIAVVCLHTHRLASCAVDVFRFDGGIV